MRLSIFIFSLLAFQNENLIQKDKMKVITGFKIIIKYVHKAMLTNTQGYLLVLHIAHGNYF